MVFIPGEVISAATFPGVIVHESAHLLFCRLRKVAVLDVCFFRLGGNPAGYVVHESPKNFTTTFLISMGPFFVNSLLCILICLPTFFPMKIFDQSDPLSMLLIWLGISIGMHAFPSNQDAMILLEQAKVAAKRFNVLAILTFPLIVAVFLANLGRFFWLDAFYGFALGWGVPELLLNRLL